MHPSLKLTTPLLPSQIGQPAQQNRSNPCEIDFPIETSHQQANRRYGYNRDDWRSPERKGYAERAIVVRTPVSQNNQGNVDGKESKECRQRRQFRENFHVTDGYK